MRRSILLIFSILVLLLTGCKQKHSKGTFVIIESQYGDITVHLYPDKAPKTVASFLSYVDKGYYKRSTFYRVLKSEDQPSNAFKSDIIQGGIYQSNYALSIKIHGIEHESTARTGISHTSGTISLARTTPGTASSEFFICIGDQPGYDSGGNANSDGLGYAAFGRVVSGFEIIRKIHDQPANGDDLYPPITIMDIRRDE